MPTIDPDEVIALEQEQQQQRHQYAVEKPVLISGAEERMGFFGDERDLVDQNKKDYSTDIQHACIYVFRLSFRGKMAHRQKTERMLQRIAIAEFDLDVSYRRLESQKKNTQNMMKQKKDDKYAAMMLAQQYNSVNNRMNKCTRAQMTLKNFKSFVESATESTQIVAAMTRTMADMKVITQGLDPGDINKLSGAFEDMANTMDAMDMTVNMSLEAVAPGTDDYSLTPAGFNAIFAEVGVPIHIDSEAEGRNLSDLYLRS